MHKDIRKPLMFPPIVPFWPDYFHWSLFGYFTLTKFNTYPLFIERKQNHIKSIGSDREGILFTRYYLRIHLSVHIAIHATWPDRKIKRN